MDLPYHRQNHSCRTHRARMVPCTAEQDPGCDCAWRTAVDDGLGGAGDE
jgi:hypothetical protein